MDLESLLFYLLLLVLGFGVLQAVFIGGLFFFKRTGEKRANTFFALLLITFGLTLLHNILTVTGFYQTHERFYFLPIYYTLAFPVLLFFYVKLNLYPKYKLRWTDGKHFILPLGQGIFFVVLFLTTIEYKSQIERNFFNPFFGAFEQFLYLSTFFAYMYFAYRYVQQKRRSLSNPREAKKVLYLKKLLQILFVLFCVHSIFVVADFISFELLNINMRSVKPYAAFGMLSFAALLFWLGLYGFQVLLWGRKIFKLDQKAKS